MRRLLVLAATATLVGCRFWYKPVPVANAIGDETATLLADTVHVYRGDQFQVYGPNSEAVYDGYEQLSRAYRSFEQHFGSTPVKLAVRLLPDEEVPLDSGLAQSFRDKGMKIIQYARPPEVRSLPRYRGIQYGGVLWPIAPAAVRALLAEFAREQLGGTTQPDSTLLARFPLWYRAAVMRVLGDAATYGYDIERVQEKSHELIPLRSMLPIVRSPGADSLIDPSREPVDEYTLTLAAQSSTFARYLLQSEGPMVLLHLGRGFVQGRSFADMMAEFSSAPRTIEELESGWKSWIATRE